VRPAALNDPGEEKTVPEEFQADPDQLAAVSSGNLPNVRDDLRSSACALGQVEMSDAVIGGYPYAGEDGNPGTVCAGLLAAVALTQRRMADDLDSAAVALARIVRGEAAG
jgi:hypothetical protein